MSEEVNVSQVQNREVEKYRLITTWNAQLTKHTFLWCGVVIGYLLCLIIN